MLLSSGVPFGMGTVEFSLISLFTQARDIYRISADRFLSERLADIATLLYRQAGGKDTDMFDKERREAASSLSAIFSPFAGEEAEKRRLQKKLREESDRKKRAFMERMEDMGTLSVQDFIKAAAQAL
ncbi:MAG: hypothetical protein ACI4P0_04860 [Mailhella sp.]